MATTVENFVIEAVPFWNPALIIWLAVAAVLFIGVAVVAYCAEDTAIGLLCAFFLAAIPACAGLAFTYIGQDEETERRQVAAMEDMGYSSITIYNMGAFTAADENNAYVSGVITQDPKSVGKFWISKFE